MLPLAIELGIPNCFKLLSELSENASLLSFYGEAKASAKILNLSDACAMHVEMGSVRVSLCEDLLRVMEQKPFPYIYVDWLAG